MDIEVDCEGYERPSGRLLDSNHLDGSKKLNSIDEQVDSGLGSIGYFSGELSNLSIPLDTAFEENCEDVDVKPANLGSIDLADSFTKLNIEHTSSCSMSKDPNQCDSGLDVTEFVQGHNSRDYSVTERSISSFSPQEVMEIFSGDEDGDNHLHLSIIHSLPEVTMQIISLAPNFDWLNQTNDLLQTALHIAVITHETSVVRRLMCSGASVDVRDQMGNTPLHNACRLGFEDCVRTLTTPVKYEEVQKSKSNIPFQRLPQDLETRNYEGLTCLHLAAIGGHINVMRHLLSVGANVNTAEGKSGRTVLHFAAEWGHIDMLKFLLTRKDTNLDARTYSGLTPILLALGRQHQQVVDELIQHGAHDNLYLSDDSDADNSDEEMVEDVVRNRPFGALQKRASHHSYR